MVGGRHPSESGTFTAGFEPICNECAEMDPPERKDPSSGSRSAMTQDQLDQAVPSRPSTPVPPAPHVHTHSHAPGHVHPKKTHRRRSMRLVRRSAGSNAGIIIAVVILAVAVLVGLMIAASK
jgi:hypothetical protein